MRYPIRAVTVDVRHEEIAAFAAALGLGDPDGRSAPWTYPAIWLAHPMVREAIVASLREGEVPFHETQEFSYAAGTLAAGTSLVMQGCVSREEGREKARIVVELGFEKNDASVARLTCRLIAIRAAAGGDPDAPGRA